MIDDEEEEEEKRYDWEEDDEEVYQDAVGRRYPYALKKGIEARYLDPDAENDMASWKECTVCLYDKDVKKIRVAPAKKNGDKSIKVSLEDYKEKFGRWGRAEADTEIVTVDMIRSAMNEELQGHAKRIDEQYHELAKFSPIETKERIRETRRHIIEGVTEETGSRKYAIEENSHHGRN